MPKIKVFKVPNAVYIRPREYCILCVNCGNCSGTELAIINCGTEAHIVCNICGQEEVLSAE